MVTESPTSKSKPQPRRRDTQALKREVGGRGKLTKKKILVPVVYCVLLPLERAFPLTHHGLELDQLRARDRARHARLLQGSVSGGVVDFSLQGSSDPIVAG